MSNKIRMPKVGDVVQDVKSGRIAVVDYVNPDSEVLHENVIIRGGAYSFKAFSERFIYHDSPIEKMVTNYQETKKIQSETHTVDSIEYLVSLYAVGGEDYPKVGDTVYSKKRGYECEVTSIDIEDSTICLDDSDCNSLEEFYRYYATTKPTEDPKPTLSPNGNAIGLPKGAIVDFFPVVPTANKPTAKRPNLGDIVTVEYQGGRRECGVVVRYHSTEDVFQIAVGKFTPLVASISDILWNEGGLVVGMELFCIDRSNKDQDGVITGIVVLHGSIFCSIRNFAGTKTELVGKMEVDDFFRKYTIAIPKDRQLSTILKQKQ